MTTKLKSTKRNIKVQELPKKAKTLTRKEQQKIKGGLLPYIEQDNVIKPTNIKDGTSNTIMKNN
jgi:hypothetical protein